MTDKQTIINGVDVSECVCFAHYHTVANNNGIILLDIANSCVPKQKPCENIKSCCFKKLTKQLKRKEQECEKLINKNNLLETELNQIKLLLEGKNTQYSQLKAENELLQEQNNKFYLFNKKLIDDKFKIACQKRTYKQALDEIEKLLDRNSIETLDGKISDIINKAKDGE